MDNFVVLVPSDQGQIRLCKRVDTRVRYAYWCGCGTEAEALAVAADIGRVSRGPLMGLAPVILSGELWSKLPMTPIPMGNLPEACFRLPVGAMDSFAGISLQRSA